MLDLMLPLPGLSPLSDKKVVVNFDGGLLSSDGGVLALREIEQRLRVVERLAFLIFLVFVILVRDPSRGFIGTRILNQNAGRKTGTVAQKGCSVCWPDEHN